MILLHMQPIRLNLLQWLILRNIHPEMINILHCPIIPQIWQRDSTPQIDWFFGRRAHVGWNHYSSTLNNKEKWRRRRKKARTVQLQHERAPLSTGTSTTVNLIQKPAICSKKIKCTMDVIHRQKIVPVTQVLNIKYIQHI